MFIDNKYRKWYFNIIESAKSKTREGYLERHHIYPTSLFGKNDDVVRLTAREHYVCHWLLTKFTEGTAHLKMAHALAQMTNHKVAGRPQWSSLEYRVAKETISRARKGMKFTDEHKAALSEAHKGIVQSEKTKVKRSESLKRAHADGRHAGMRGKKWEDIATPEAREARGKRVSEGLKARSDRLREETGKGLSQEHIEKIKSSGFGAHWKGKTRSEETKAKMAEARRAYWAAKKASGSLTQR